MELTTDNLKLEEELEKTINSDIETEIKVKTIKTLLAKIVATEASIVKFTNIFSANQPKSE